jgi:hypothetical protein
VPRREISVSAGMLGWAAVTLAFLGLRLGVTWQAPVGGAELAHLSGAWQAAEGHETSSFIPTLFQGLTALLLKFSTSEVPARVLAYLVTASAPAAIYLLRRALGEGGALFTLLLLALDPIGIWQSVAASASAADIAICLWLLVVIDRGGKEVWLWGPLGFLVATAGPLPGLLGGAAIAVALARGRSVDAGAGIACAAGGLAGLLAASAGFGFGIRGLAIPPLDLLSDSFNRDTSTATGFDVLLLFAWPTLVLGLAGAAFRVANRGLGLSNMHLVLLAWFGLGLAWLIVGAGTHDVLAVTAATTPAALLAGPFLAAAIAAAVRADWTYARFVLPAAGYATLVAFAVMERWGRAGEVKSGGEAAIVALLLAGAFAALAWIATQRAAQPVLAAAGIVFLAPILVAGAFAIGLSGASEPVPSPYVSPETRVLRDVALKASEEGGGTIVIHPGYAGTAAWVFRDIPGVVVSDQVPAGAALVIWPMELPNPEGLVPLVGEWALLRAVKPPVDDFPEYLNWFSDRNGVVTRNEPVAVYTGESE